MQPLTLQETIFCFFRASCVREAVPDLKDPPELVYDPLSGLYFMPGGCPNEPVTMCNGCKKEIDPDCCWCGDGPDTHNWDSGHPFIPYGCDCHRDTGSSLDALE